MCPCSTSASDMRTTRALKSAAPLFKAATEASSSEGGAVVMGIAGICATGGVIYAAWMANIASRKPKTFSPQWVAATAKYRAAQNQDPISSQ